MSHEVREPNAKYLAKAAYKQTEVGVIPEDWDVRALGDLAQIHTGIAKNTNAELLDPIEVPYLRVANVQDGYLDLNEVSTIRIDRGDLRRFSVLPNDVLMNEGGDLDKLGRGALWRGQIQPCVHQNHVFVVRCKDRLLPEFLNAWTSSPGARRYFLLAGRQTTNLASINKTSLGQLPVPVPTGAAEQQAIAEALSDADALIEALEQLLAKKRQIKQGAMQELLTGQKRLPGFAGEWDTTRLGDVVQLRKERLDPRRSSAQEFCVELEHIDQGGGTLIGHTATGEGSSLKSIFQKDDVLFGKLRAYLRKYWLATRDGVCSTEIWVLVAKRTLLTPQFLFQLVKVDRFVEVASSAYGTHMPRSDWSVVRNYELSLPSVEEQTAIATLLSDMDAEIAALEAKLGKARGVKQGMMQELLTGRIRLV